MKEMFYIFPIKKKKKKKKKKLKKKKKKKKKKEREKNFSFFNKMLTNFSYNTTKLILKILIIKF